MSIYQATYSRDYVEGSSAADTIKGLDENDIVLGLQNDDLIFGNQGNDWIAGNEDKDTLAGGKGNDTLHAGKEDDIIFGQLDNDLVYGDLGNDSALGGNAKDWIEGNKGNDWLAGNIDNDSIFGGEGNDTAHGGKEDDLINGQQGDDALCGDIGNDILEGGEGKDLLFGNTQADWLGGNEENDTLHGGKENDTLHGGKNDDLLFGEIGNDIICGDLDNDTALGGIGTDSLEGEQGNDQLYGNEENDTLSGGDGDDTLHGGQNNDLLYGDKGNDLHSGDLGADTIYGAEGDDTFVIGRRNDIPGYISTGGPQILDADWLNDFGTGNDVLSLIGGLTYDQLNIFAGTDQFAGYTIIQDKVLGEYLAILKGIQPDFLTGDTNFVKLRDSQPPILSPSIDNGGNIPFPPTDDNSGVDSGGGDAGGDGGNAGGDGGNTGGGNAGGGNAGGGNTGVDGGNAGGGNAGGGNAGGGNAGGGNTGGGNAGGGNAGGGNTGVDGGNAGAGNAGGGNTGVDGGIVGGGNTGVDGGNAGAGNAGGGNTGVDGGNAGGGNTGVDGGNAGGGNAGVDGGNAGGGNTGVDGGNAGGGNAGVDGGNAGGGGTTENQPPIFTGTTEFSINEDTPAIIPNPLDNSRDPNNDPLSIINFSQPNNGILTQNEDGTFTYTPNPNFNGTDSFTVEISDGKGGTTSTQIILTINPVDDPLLVGNDNYTTNENIPITLANLLENDSSIDGSKFSITNVSNPQNGILTPNQDGTFTYTPNPKYHGTDDFTYTITDSKGNTNTGTVNITINSINENPIVPNETFTLQEDTPFVLTNLLANATDGDGDVLTIASFSNPQNGTLRDNQDGTFTYIPNPNFNGTDQFTYTITDGNGGTTTAIATLNINAVEDLPVAVVDSFTTLQNVPVNIPIANLLQNDSDADGDPLTLSNIFTNPSNGTLAQNNDGTWTYTPNPNFNGQDSFTYTISDSKGNITTGTINISIGAVNQPPQITGETFTTAEDTPLLLGNLLGNDSDVENNTLTITEFNGLQNGTLTNNQNGTWTYIPSANFNGQEIISYTVSDGNGGLSIGIININVTPVNDLPTISPIANQTTTQNTPTNPFNFIVSDVETDPANLTITTTANAALVQNINVLTGATSNERTISITPAPGTFGTTTITVTVNDGSATSSQTFNLTVQAVPVANPDNAGPVFLRTPLEIPIAKLLENDSDADSTVKNFIGVSNALNGTVSVGQNGIITFQANPNFSGTGSFDYTISDESGNTATATVTIPVIAELSLGNITTGVGLPVGVGGFSIFGEAAADNAGWSVGGIQDLNNDGFADLLVSAPSADANALANSGKVYVVFGKTDGGIITLSTVSAGNGGFVVNGEAANNLTGHEVSTAGDVNGDNLPDLIIGAKSVNGGAGKVYVVLGSTLTTPVNLSSVSAGIGGFALNGELNSAAGNSVSDAGDVNGDGLSDLIIGAPDFSFDSSRMGAGRSYVVYGSTNPTTMNLSDVAAGIGGFAINGEAGGDNSGASVRSAGDVNGDGFADLIVGARFADNPGLGDAGKSYIIFGGANLSSVDLLNVAAGGGGGFVISGLSANDRAGTSVSNAGDVNGDGLSDLIISSPGADALGAVDSGKAYVVFGQTASGVVSLANVEAGIGGFVINGANANDFAGDTVRSAGDMNGDGFADLVVGAPRADQLSTNPPLTDLGKAFIIFGKSSTEQVNLSSVVTGNGGFSLTGEQAGDYMGRSVRVAGDVNGDGFDDLVIGSRFADPNNLGNAGKAYVVFGGNSSGAVSLPGTALDDVLTGTSAGESLVGGFGNDSLIGNGGPDVFYGGAGNDLIAVSSADFRLVNGGEGFDTLRLDGLSLNLSAIADGRLSSIERFDLSGVANNSLVLSRTEVLNLGTTSNQLVIDGTSGNTLTLADGLNTWQSGGPTTFNGSTYNLYQQGLASLLVDPEITVL